MFSATPTDIQDALIQNRLQRCAQALRQASFSTREDWQAEILTQCNTVFGSAGSMTPLQLPAAATPAVIGDITGNLSLLNQDATDVAAELLSAENVAGVNYNMAASSQNAIRQKIRERIYGPTPTVWREPFLHARNLASYTATLDFDAGSAFLPLTSETFYSPSIALGLSTLGSSTSDLANLTDGNIETVYTFNGSRLELVLSFPSTVIVNRVQFQLDTYDGMEIVSWTSSPDGTLSDDLLAQLGGNQLLSSLTGKDSGDCIFDMPPNSVQSMRIVIEDRSGLQRIGLRGLLVSGRQYSSSASLTSVPILRPSGTLVLSTQESSLDPYTRITHQISLDGISYQSLLPGVPIALAVPFWYRALLSRNDSLFASTLTSASALNLTLSANYQIVSLSSQPCGSGLVQNTLVFSNVTGPISLLDTPLGNSLVVQSGSRILQGPDYAFTDNVLSFPATQASLIVRYQVSGSGTGPTASRRTYYSPLLTDVRFEAA